MHCGCTRDGGVWLKDLPADLMEMLEQYDENEDGYLDAAEMLLASDDMERMRMLCQTGRLPIKSFPEHKQKMLRKHDLNKDGELDVVEIIHGFDALQREKRRQKQLAYFLL
eukprot:1305821-Rhodomonas_salina.1